MSGLTNEIQQVYENWLSHLPAGAERDALEAMRGDEDAILSHFAVPMQFGTAGLRSTMDVGPSHMNVYTVAQTTKGLADLILQSGGAQRGVAIAYDSRNQSEHFARTAACVLADAGIQVYLFDGIRPTPELSFSILHLHCIAGINITASHNTKAYNGYKVYWEDGAQLPPEHAASVSAFAAKVDCFSVPLADFGTAVQNGSIRLLGSETDEAFLSAVMGCSLAPELVKRHGDALHLLYTPLHGTGYRLVPDILRRIGVSNLQTVDEQMIPNGDFPTVASPNPENAACFTLAIERIQKEHIPCEMILASDPDADRIGVAIREENGSYRVLNGNQIGALLIDYILRIRTEKGNLPSNGCAIKSIVSSNLFDRICDAWGVSHISVLTGFKYIGEKIKQWADSGEHTFLFGYEESQGYLSGGYARDKDAVAGCMLAVEMACYHASKGQTVAQALQQLYNRFGYYRESLLNVTVGGLNPMQIMAERMEAIRESKLSDIAGSKVLRTRDYRSGIIRAADGLEAPTGLPQSDVLYYELENGDAVVVRPSGTEPKIKAYLLVRGETEQEAEAKLSRFGDFMGKLLQN